MTVIAARVRDGRADIASDSQTRYGALTFDGGTKIRQLGTNLLIGVAGTPDLLVFLEELQLNVGNVKDADVFRMLREELSPLWRAWCKEHEKLRTDADGHICYPCEAIFAWPQGLALLADDGHLVSIRDGYTAAGSGASFALGALFSANTYEDLHGHGNKDAVIDAVLAASRHSPSCGGEVHHLTVSAEATAADAD